jgi:hypothetical protein
LLQEKELKGKSFSLIQGELKRKACAGWFNSKTSLDWRNPDGRYNG